MKPRDVPQLIRTHEYSTSALQLLNDFYSIPILSVVTANFFLLVIWSYVVFNELTVTLPEDASMNQLMNFCGLSTWGSLLCYQIYSIVRACENFRKEVSIHFIFLQVSS
jgi:hypothetical protein